MFYVDNILHLGILDKNKYIGNNINNKIIFNDFKMGNRITMLRNSLFSFFLFIALLCFNGRTKAMEELKQDEPIAKQVNVKKKLLHTLKFIAASKVKSLKLPQNSMPGEVRDYCSCIALVDAHCNSLEKFKEPEYEYLKVTEENLYCYRKLLDEIFDKQYADFDLVLLALNEYFRLMIESYYWFDIKPIIVLTDFIPALDEINVMLSLIIKENAAKFNVSFDQIVFENERACFDKIVRFVLNKGLNNLCMLLVDANLLPSVDSLLDTYDNFLFISLVCSCISIEILHAIVGMEKNKDCDWEKIFSKQNIGGATLLHFAINGRFDIFEYIIALIKDKGLAFEKFINIQNDLGMTPLIQAAFSNPQAVELLINNGALTELLSHSGKTALSYAQEMLSLLKSNPLGKDYEAASRCLQLLEEADKNNAAKK